MADDVIVVRDGRKYKNLVTGIGQAKIAQAALEGKKVNIVQMAVGDGGGGYYIPSADATALRHEVWRGDITRKEINKNSSNMIDVRTVLDSSVGGFTVREAALYDDEGDMIVVGNLPDIEKVAIVEGISASLTILLHVVFSNVDAVEIKVNGQIDAVSKADMERAIRQAVASTVAVPEPEKVTIPADGWEETADTAVLEAYGYQRDIVIDGVTDTMWPMLAVYPAYQAAAMRCGLCSTAQTMDGALRVYAKVVPTTEIKGELTLLRANTGIHTGSNGGGGGANAYVLPVATATRLGGVKLGDGFTTAPDGTLSYTGSGLPAESVVTSSDTEEMLNEVFPPEESQN